MVQKNDIMLINDIVYKIHAIEDFDTMRTSVLEILQFLIPYECATFYLASPDTPYELADPIGSNVNPQDLYTYLEEYQQLDYTRWSFDSFSGKAYRESDLLDEKIRINHPYYQKLFAPLGIHYSMLLTIIRNGVFLGVISLYRTRKQGDFSDNELFLFELLENHLSLRCFHSAKSRLQPSDNYPSKKDLVEEYNLTLREIEITYKLLDGTSREMICEQLGISPNTLKKHILNIYRKLDINSWRELFQLLKA